MCSEGSMIESVFVCPQVATQFKSSLVGLIKILTAKEPSYVRCLKPNDGKQAGEAGTGLEVDVQGACTVALF